MASRKRRKLCSCRKGGSAWESALTIIFLSEASHIFESCNEELELRHRISYKSAAVACWLLTKKRTTEIDGINYIFLEDVTWDTAVIIRGLLVSLKEYKREFSAIQQNEIIEAAVDATKWLYFRFGKWETNIKYPFGPADVGQIVITLVYIMSEYPEIYDRIQKEYYNVSPPHNLVTEIVEYLLHIKTDRSLTIQTGKGETEAMF